MNDEEQNKATILERALSFSSKEARDAYLQGVCGANAQLRARLDALIKAHFAADDFLDGKAPARERSTIVVQPVSEEAPGTRIGRYKLLEKIGEGGMGVVYMAEQQEPVRRRVALKIIKLGMDTKQVVARFEAERQALALMDHPNIAKVLDGAATESGRPYFVMELVRGVPITEYCDKNRLSTRPRLDLFVQVCHAIQHAHQKGLIHRDLKPSNILVTLNDGVPSPMVIDFGIAKATNQRLTEKTLFTNYATMIGTPAYMSPEQAEMSKLDVDTRTDIYSLGVLLYELLTGETPFPAKKLLGVGYAEMQRIIAEQEPIRPSTRLSTMAHEERTVVAKNRSLEASALGRLFRGDLDWIVMKCLEKDRTRRYETANGLAMDIGRYVLNEPVLACPPSAAYRFQKLIRRNRIAFAAGSLVIAALTLGLVTSTWQAIRARKAELQQFRMREKADQALANEARERQAAEAARIAERDQRKQAESIRYASDMNLAQQALKDGNFGRVWELLDRNRPIPSHDDLRGWEWRYLWQQSRPDEFIDLGRAEYAHGLALSHDRRWLAVAAHAGLSIRDISDLHAPHEIALLPTKPPGFVAFSPSENLLAYTSVEWDVDRSPLRTTLVLWSAETRTATATLTITDYCSSVVFSADGRTLATLSGNWDPTAHLELWQIPSGTLIASHALLPMNFNGGGNGKLALAPDLSWAAIAGRRLSVVDLATDHERWGIDCDPDSGGFGCLALSPDGKFLVSSGGRPASLPSIAVWDTASGREIGPHGMDPRASANQVAFSPDGSTLVSSGGDRAIRIWDFTDPTRMHLRGRSLRGHRSGGFYAVLARDGKTLITASADHSLYAWDIQHPRDEPTVVTWTNIIDWAFSPASDAVATFDRDGELAQWQGPGMATKTVLLKSSEIGSSVADNRLSDNGSWFAVSYTGGLIKIWDLRRHAELRQFTVDSKSPYLWGGSADGTKLLVENNESQLAEWDVTKGRKLREWTASRNSVRVDTGWNWILMSKERPSDTLSIIEMATGQRREVSAPLTRPMKINFSDDGGLFAACSYLGYIRIWDTSSLREVCTLGGGQGPVYSVSFSPDRTRLLGGSSAGLSFLLYDLKSKQELISVPGGTMPTWDARFSPDGNLIGALSRSTLHVHRAPTFAEIEAAEHAQGKVASKP